VLRGKGGSLHNDVDGLTTSIEGFKRSVEKVKRTESRVILRVAPAKDGEGDRYIAVVD
jgi:hypothetical protein